MATNNKKKLTQAEENAILQELFGVSKSNNNNNRKSISRLVIFNVPEDDFYRNTYSDIDQYMDNVVNGCPVFDISTKQALSAAEFNQYMDHVLSKL